MLKTEVINEIADALRNKTYALDQEHRTLQVSTDQVITRLMFEKLAPLVSGMSLYGGVLTFRIKPDAEV